MKDLFDFKGRLVVTRDEGVRLGVTSELVIDEAVGRISAMTFHRRWHSADRWVHTSDIVSVGPDLVVISSRRSVNGGKHGGRRLADYRGCWATKMSGEHLGRLVDIGTDGKDWGVQRLEFDDGSSVDLDGKEMVFGRHEILTPDYAEKREGAPPRRGIGARLRGWSRSIFQVTEKSATDEQKSDGSGP